MSYRILIVDDSATIRAMVKRIIRMAGLEIEQLHEAANGKLALDLLATTPVDLILADLNMPEMDGFEMTRRIHADPTLKQIPIIVISANPSAEDFARLQHVKGYLGKPFTPEGIRDVITRALEVQHA
jgi:two-component system chemotaxis response regulator CheY